MAECRRLADRSLFVPGIAGLNLEHIVNGTPIDTDELFFEPRRAPMTLQTVSETVARLHQPATFATGVESTTEFHLSALNILDMHFDQSTVRHRSDGIRLTHSPSGGGFDSARRTSNPAWDFQFLIRNPEINVARGFAVRTIPGPAIDRDALPDMVAEWQREAMNRP
ncbi:MAG: hypothetical protein ACKOEO_20685 [Planctomycetaceae bacterium]